MNKRIKSSRRQCYDEAAAMKGAKLGVTIQFQWLNGHTFGLSLILVVKDAYLKVKWSRETFKAVKKYDC